ncbi:restriction modification system DNA specificity domain-containing protein [Aeromonas caviae]|uniref:Restriction modification system DNA specificity domain-containing protein n=1 Tax=Aeromonas caviae TaxID=648 RepID=A0ABD0B4G7_AERCA|nr:restriction endonuclease subunit S [Aeromonas caviae]GJA80934.1 restriction modification system DNA specificity domain-containing protein [Aeromonas caviae]GJB11526.1 restriction modification system DNA specificity domain-containing protein [Aeromonas caviae]GJB24752.1 restriction modification system DNA specificity domain-containing protein [Aeromonas caviae]GJB32252.1 restriction modification system DNA specificity domain-containing protein [Aeromonas caviae]GJB58456.1 restriction modific
MSVIEHQAERVGKYQPYPEYNNSGYSWMAKIPSGWLNGPLKRIAYLQAGFAFKGDTFNTSEGVPIVRMNNILNSGGLSLDDAVRVPEIDVKPEFYLATGDIVMGMSGSIENIAKVQGDDLPCALNQRVGRFVLRAVDDGFLWYLIQSNGFKQQVSLAATGTAQLNISSDQVGNTLVSWPVSLLEQNIIAAFLDYETARIDRLIAQQQRLIELLKEKRQAVISHAVTKGLNPNAPMKDSGVEWLGQVPEHWVVTRAKNLFKFITSGSRGWAEYYADEGELFFRIANLTRDTIRPKLESIQFVKPPTGAEGERSRIRSGDLLISITADLGSVCVADDTVTGGYVSQHVALARPNDLVESSDWLAYFVLSDSSKEQLLGSGYGGTKLQLSLEDVRELWVVQPPCAEQEKISIFLLEKLERYETLMTNAQNQIWLLQERRTALISAAVTGKIDLRGWAPPAEEAAA